jgi:hypothetical protein
MNLQRKAKNIALITSLVIVCTVIGSIPNSAHAYRTGSKWPNTTTASYRINPALDTLLSRPGASNQIAIAANQWNRSSRFKLVSAAWVDGSTGNVITAQNFASSPPCNQPDTTKAVVCLDSSPTTINRAPMYLNNSPTKSWNISGIQNTSTNPEQLDVQAIVLHEFGHFHFLYDNPSGQPAAVMNFQPGTYKPTLREDDQEGATQLYGPKTGFELDELQGRRNTNAYRFNTTGYPPASLPELGPGPGEFGVPVPSGSRYNRLAGTANASYSYAYLILTSSIYDQPVTSQVNYMRINSGMKLKWLQYNHEQTNMAVDFLMSDGTTLRDSGLVDQNGVPVHPAARTSYPTGQWLYFEVNLSPLAGKVITQFMIAYDNGNNGRTGKFRGYFDDIQITP